jgi:lysophospholipase L1-like esterase
VGVTRAVKTGGLLLALAAWTMLSIVWKFHVAGLARHEGALGVLFMLGLVGAGTAWSLERWGTRRVRVATLKGGLAIVAIAVALVPTEFIARYVYRDVYSSADGRDYFGHRHGGPRIHANTLGFREREIGPKSPDRYRIAIVGDSFTWGQGIEESERYSNLLQRYLGPGYEVLNFGVPGNNLPEHGQVLEQTLPVSPDFVLLQLYVNDWEMPEMDRPNADPLLPWPTLDAWLLRNSVLYDMTNRAWEQFEAAAGLVESYPHYMERNLRDPNSPNAREADRLLRGFFERARRAGVAAGAVFFPNPGYLAKDYPFDYLHERVQATCVEEHVPCLDLRAPFAATFRVPQLMWVSRFDQHPNARANRKAAQEIAARFGSVWHR